jgi:hypothetical protein
MKLVHVTVMVEDIIWDEFLISEDRVLFITFNRQCSNNDIGHLEELLESIKANESVVSHHKGATLIESNINNVQHINGQDSMEKVNKSDISFCVEGDTDMLQKQKLRIPKYVMKLCINGHILSLFVKTLQQSAVYRKSVVTNFKECTKKMGIVSQPSGMVKVNMKLVCPHKAIIDYAWYV